MVAHTSSVHLDSGLRHRLGTMAHRSVASVASRRGAASRVIAGISRTFVRAYDGTTGQYDINTNGERWLLEHLVGHLDVVFDVGANIGDWSAIAVECGAGSVHAFEISPATADTVKQRFAASSVVEVNAIGLGEAPGSVTIHHYPDEPYLTTTATEFPHAARYEVLEVPVQRGDRYAVDRGIASIDLLKIDVEGAEPSVLRGFESFLADGRVGAIQFEYGVVAVIDKFLMSDFYDLLAGFGYDIGPLRPDGVVFQDYNLGLERFDDVNFVAVHRSRPDLRALVSRPA